MGTRTEAGSRGRKRTRTRSAQQRESPERREDYDESRRKLYRDNPDYRKRVKDNSRRQYRKDNPKGHNPLPDRQPLIDGEYKEMRHNSGGDPFYEYAYTIIKASAALGKTPLTVKKWIKDRIIPEPVYEDTSHGYAHYLDWEVNVLAEEISLHFDEFDYLGVGHEGAISDIWNALTEARSREGRSHGNRSEK